MQDTNIDFNLPIATTAETDELLMAIFGKTLLEILLEMGNNQTGAMLLLANNQTHYNQAIIHTTFNLLKQYVSASSLDMYLDTASRRFALDGTKVSLQKIGKDWDMSRERIRQVENSILRLLRMPAHKAQYIKAIQAVVN